ncbi:4-phosphoerythronate dehydrogenase [Fluviicoccus keumensis]|uniref:Erythronate-4-phosphate dehydrogenase n=2 Tax=Fluviicoccus keumensis TaxID=1435465 RepID=A0A4V2G3H7_9GAMM|nr:4-phosphoerythronate dehydrogenase [Fluviicoccus keumensis]
MSGLSVSGRVKDDIKGMKIVADENLSLVRELFGSMGELVCLPGRSMRPEDVREADILLVRSVTRVNATLLASSRVRFVGSATIGTDHLDTAWLDGQGIAWTSAPGCNAMSVVEYVIAALFELWARGDVDWDRQVMGIVGLGNVGARLAVVLQRLGVRVLGCDPFVDLEGVEQVDIDTLLDRADVVSLHTPLTHAGPHPTFHLLDRSRLARFAGKVLINSGRGPVVDNAALLALIVSGCFDPGKVVLDVWEKEPDLDRALLAKIRIGTPHIAGYSQEGKWRGSLMVAEALSNFLGTAPPEAPALTGRALSEVKIVESGQGWSGLASLVKAFYPISRDDADLRRELLERDMLPGAFDALRKGYWPRREFSSGRVRLVGVEDPWLKERMLALNFRLEA